MIRLSLPVAFDAEHKPAHLVIAAQLPAAEIRAGGCVVVDGTGRAGPSWTNRRSDADHAIARARRLVAGIGSDVTACPAIGWRRHRHGLQRHVGGRCGSNPGSDPDTSKQKLLHSHPPK